MSDPNSKRVNILDVFDTWPKYKNWVVLHNDKWEPLHDIMAGADLSYIWIDFENDAHDEQANGPGMRLTKDDLITIKTATENILDVEMTASSEDDSADTSDDDIPDDIRTACDARKLLRDLVAKAALDQAKLQAGRASDQHATDDDLVVIKTPGSDNDDESVSESIQLALDRLDRINRGEIPLV